MSEQELPAGADGAARGALACRSPRPSRRTSRTAFADLPLKKGDPLLGFKPYRHKAPRRNSITPERQRDFIACLAATGIVTQAARQIGASLEALYRLRHQPGAEGFSAAWEAAIDRGIARLEDCALERAIAGEPREILKNGEVVARWVRYDTALLLFLLRQRRGKRWHSEGAHFANLRPGHPVYDRLRAEWTREDNARRAADSEKIIQSINAKLELMRQRRLAAEARDAAEREAESAADLGLPDAGGAAAG
jgi:antitoxin (DNA-binding transcriptional repressor) of toxin-antitoxin stability system